MDRFAKARDRGGAYLLTQLHDSAVAGKLWPDKVWRELVLVSSWK